MRKYIDIHTHRTDSVQDVLSVYNLPTPFTNVPLREFYSAGWHPWDIENVSLSEIESSLELVITENRCLAIGECGLDRVKGAGWKKQIEAFKLHLNIAGDRHKPVIVHCVKAYSDLLSIFKKERFTGKVILHGFTGNTRIIEQFGEYNTYFSIGPLLLHEKSKIQETIKAIPQNRLFFETDDTNFSIREIYLRATEILEVSEEELSEKIWNNFIELTDDRLVEQNPIING